MQELIVDIDGREVRIDPHHVSVIGRASDAEVPASGTSVSRHHAELRPGADGWTLVDLGGTHGTFVDGRRISELKIIPPLTVQLGLAESGTEIVIRDGSAPDPTAHVASDADTHAARPAQDAAPPEHGRTAILGSDELAAYANTLPAAEAHRPEAARMPTGLPDLFVRASGTDYRFVHPARVVIGRQPDCDVVVSDPACSRVHGHVEATEEGWTYTNDSDQGSFVDGRRRQVLAVRGPTTLRLGHPDAGPEVQMTPLVSADAAEQRVVHRVRRRRLLMAGGGLAVVVALVAGGLLLRDDTSEPGADTLTAAELDAAKVSTVLITAETDTTDGERVTYSGSGTIISEDGMILTNAHVGAPATPELEQRYGSSELLDPDYLQISLIEDAADSPAAPAYRARVLRTLGDYDATILQIYATIDGTKIDDDLDLPALTIGDSDKLTAGDDVTLLGFPAISESMRVTVTRGVISTFIDVPGLGDRAEIDTDARIAAGNSGGAAINSAGEIIGIPSATFSLEDSPTESGRIIPINKVKPLIKDASGGR